jgi:hypothetical protein
MVHFAILSLFVLFHSISAQSDTNVCSNVASDLGTCTRNSGSSITIDNSVGTKCITCAIGKNRIYGSLNQTTSTCDGTATKEICQVLSMCADDCYPTYTACQKEYDNHFSCVFGIALSASTDCFVQCDERAGGSGTGTGSNNGSTGGNTNGSSYGYKTYPQSIELSVALIAAMFGSILSG